MQDPFFSVVLTTYNRAPLLLRALESLIQQQEQDWEAIIIDDGSNDRTQEVVLPYLKSFKGKIRYFKQENSGVVSAKNKGASLAVGRYVTFLDSDDEYQAHHLRCRKLMLRAHPETELLYGGARVIGNPYVPDRYRPGERIHLSKCTIGGTFFIERKFLLHFGGFHTFTIGSDADLFERIKSSGAKMLQTNIPSYLYRREIGASITHDFASRMHS